MQLTVIIISLGDDARLIPCLNALKPELEGLTSEVLLFQNAVEEAPAPDLPIEPKIRDRSAINRGFAPVLDDALKVARGRFILTLNPDAQLQKGSLQVALQELHDCEDLGAIAFRLLRPGGAILDSAGVKLGPIRRAKDRGMGQPALGRFESPADVDAACMACALFRREALEAARDGAGEIIDRRFFAYKEDVDLGWRLRRAGRRIRYLPKALAIHERGWKGGARAQVPAFVRQLSYGNRWLTILKNESPLSLWLRMALYIPVEVALAFYLAVREPETLGAWKRVWREWGASRRRRPLRPRPPET